MVSRGYDARPAPMVTPQPSKKEAKNEPWRAPTRTTGSEIDVSNGLRICYRKTRTEGVVDTEVETTVDDDADDRGDEATVETGNTVRREGLLINVNETVELTGSSTLCRLGVIGETSTSVVKRVDEEQRCGTSSTTRGNIAGEPLPVAVLLLETEERLEVVLCVAHAKHQNEFWKSSKHKARTEGKVQRLGGEVPNDVGGVTAPEGNNTLVTGSTREAVRDTLVGLGKTTLLDL